MGENSNDIAQELALLQTLDGGDYSRQVEHIAQRSEFYPLKGEEGIFVCGGETDADFDNLLHAARKAFSHGFCAYLLPNPKGVRTPDLILERKGLFKVYDVKTIQGKSSAINRMKESIGQTNRIILNMTTDYNGRLLASDIKAYFEMNANAREVMIFKGNKLLLVQRGLVKNSMFNRIFRKMYEK